MIKKTKDTKNKTITKAKKNNISTKIKQSAKKTTKKVKNYEKKLQDNIKKTPKRKLKYYLSIFILGFLIFCFSVGILFLLYIIIFSPKFNTDRLYRQEASIIYDINGKEIAKIGIEKRSLVTYEDLPEILVDAIVATEDSRYFQHNGFDIARFAKASLGQVLGSSGAGGGSTITMQVSKNSFTDTTATGIKGIIRKFTDIYLSIFKIEKSYTKQEILEFYVNSPYLGSHSYGVEQTCQTYFGKSVKDLNISEAALIAGLFQSPSAYNPYSYPELATKRRNIVLNLMERHGYITAEENKLASSIPIENLLVEKTDINNKYQGFVDTVIEDVLEKTGSDPYKVPMKIYSTMVPEVQDAINDVYNGTKYEFVNDEVQLGVAVTSVKDGSISGIGANRKNGERIFNFATMISRHPGSTAKPYIDYGPAIEYNNFSTGTVLFDEPYEYSSGASIKNADSKFLGLMTVKTALAKSRNIPALQTFQQLENANIVKFASSLGINLELHDGQILESAAVGAFDGVSPLEQSAAYATFARGGYYIKPYSFTKVVYTETEEVYEYKATSTKVMKDSTASMINIILNYAVDNGLVGSLKVSGTDIAGKTGTSTYAKSTIKSFGIKSNAIMDSWLVTYSPSYSIAQWYGYKELKKNEDGTVNYLTSPQGVTARGKIGRALGNNIHKKNERFSTKGLTTEIIEKETIPIQLASAYTPADLQSKEYFVSGTEPTETSPRFSQLNNVSNASANYSSINNLVTLSWNAIETPNSINPSYLAEYFNTNYGQFAEKYYNLRLEYNASYVGSLLYHVYTKNSDGTLTSIGTTTGNRFTYTPTTSNITFVIKSEYSIMKSTSSTGTEIKFSTNQQIDTPSSNNDASSSSSSSNPSNIEVTLRGRQVDQKTVENGYYDDPGITVSKNGENITSEATITKEYCKFNTSGNCIKLEENKIPLSIIGEYKISYTIKYKEKTWTLTRTIEIK